MVTQVPDNTLYPYINNDIEYSLFKDVKDSYYLDNQIRDDFTIIMHTCHMYTIILHNKQVLQLILQSNTNYIRWKRKHHYL